MHVPGLERKDIAINIDEGVLSLEVNRPADPSLVSTYTAWQ